MNYINTLKLIALIAMVIDHMAVFFPPTIQIIMRGVGRATFVIFGFLIGLNYVNKSQNNVSAPISHNKLFKFKNIKTINWIPDFQHIHLPQMFSKKEISAIILVTRLAFLK